MKVEGVKLGECKNIDEFYVDLLIMEGWEIEIREKKGRCVMQGFVVSLIKFGQNGLLLLFGYLI